MLKAIIVDDDVTTLQGLTKNVDWKRLGIEVVGLAQNGKDGLAIIEASKPDIIITDIYMPIMDGIEMLKRLRLINNKVEVIILSGYDDFKYAQSALKLKVHDYLSKPVSLDEIESVIKAAVETILEQRRGEREEKELRELLENNLLLTKNQLFKDLVKPDMDSTSFTTKSIEFLQIDLTNRYFLVSNIEFSKNRKMFNLKPTELLSFSYAVKNIIVEMVKPQKEIYIADIQPHMAILIFSAIKPKKRDELEKRAKEFVAELLHQIRQQLEPHIWAVMGSTVDSPEEIHLSYEEAMNLLAERNLLVDKTIISKKDDRYNLSLPNSPIDIYYSIVDAAVQGPKELVGEKMQDFLKILNSMSDISIGSLREFAIDFMGVLVVILYDHGLRLEDLNANFNAYEDLNGIYDKENLMAWMNDILLTISGMMDKRASSKHKKTIDFIHRYVKAHCAEEITLEIIAEKVYLTRNYLSQIFKQATGENYSSYLTKVRMEKARELMRTGNYKLYEISEMVGYKNNAHFSRLFKKYTGHNPSEFNK